jgi:ATP-dependent RNA helicase RhlB
MISGSGRVVRFEVNLVKKNSTESAATAARAFENGLPFRDLELPAAVHEGVRAAGFEHCTPIQELVLPVALEGHDVAGQAQTGTGKTAAFLITVFTRLLNNPCKPRPGAPRALIIAPTRELVVQIAADAKILGGATDLQVQAVYGGVDYQKQRDALGENVDVLIGTPGRLIDYLKQRVYDLRRVEVLVIDEADRMFDMGFIRDIRFLLRRLPDPRDRQSMLFSATLSWRVMELGYEHMNEPRRLEVAPDQVTADNVRQILYHVGNDEKVPILVGLMRREAGDRVLIFVNMKRTAEQLEADLEANEIHAAALTGDVPQPRRLKILEEFKDGRLPVLIATDVASRGLHIEGVTHVVNYDLPQDAEDYVHRIGRTARAGASGDAISLACEDYVEALIAIEDYVGYKIPHEFPDEELLATPVRRGRRRRREGRELPRGKGKPGGTGGSSASRDPRHRRRR